MEEVMLRPWSNSKKVIFRLLFIYLILYAFPFPIQFLFERLGPIYDQWWSGPVAWVGKHLIGLDQENTVMPNGSGDTTFNYVQVFLFLFLAISGTVIWSAIDR